MAMKLLALSSAALGVGVAVAMLTGCGGSQRPIGAPGAMPLSRAISSHADRSRSWMLPEATKVDLVYVTGGCGGTCVVSYPDGKMVGHLDVGYGLNAGVCADSQGNVYISNNSESHDSEVVEYAHAGTTSIATFDLPGGAAAGCSVDSTTGNLAVMFEGSGYDVAIFTTPSQAPQLYLAPVDGFSCAYDPSGNLFVGGLADGTNAALAELPKGASEFGQLTINKAIEGAGQVQWYGKYLSYSSTFGGAPFIYRLKIAGTSADVVKTTRLSKPPKFLWYPWIYQGKILVPYDRHGTSARALGIWDYPKGRFVDKFTGFGAASLHSVTISVANASP